MNWTALRERGAAVASVHPLMTFVRGAARGSKPLARNPRWQEFRLRWKATRPQCAWRGAWFGIVGGRAYSIRKKDKAAYHAWGTFASPLFTALLATTEQVAALAGVNRKAAKQTDDSDPAADAGELCGFRRRGRIQRADCPRRRGYGETASAGRCAERLPLPFTLRWRARPCSTCRRKQEVQRSMKELSQRAAGGLGSDSLCGCVFARAATASSAITDEGKGCGDAQRQGEQCLGIEQFWAKQGTQNDQTNRREPGPTSEAAPTAKKARKTLLGLENSLVRASKKNPWQAELHDRRSPGREGWLWL